MLKSSVICYSIIVILNLAKGNCMFCNKSLGLEDGRIHDNQMHATVSAAGTKAPDARYNSSSSWCVNREENLSGFEDGVYLEIDFLKVTKITGIILAGPHNFPTHSYGSKIKLAQKLTQNGPLNSTILTTSNLVFPKSEYLKIEPPIYARFLRYLPLLNSNAKCVNMELLGCNAAFQDCNSPILNHQLSYLESSYYTTVNGQSKFLGKYIAEPISTFPWGPDVKAEFNSPYQEYVEVNLKEAYFLTAVKTFIPMYASRSLDMPAHFIFQFKSTNNMQWTNLTQLNNKLLVFNTSASLDNILEIQSKFKAMQIRIHPKIRAGKQIFLKLQLYGCLFKDAFQPKATVIVPTTPIKRTKMQTMFPTDTGRSTATNSVKAIILYYEIRQGNRYKDVPYVGKTNKDVLYDGKVGNIVDDTNSTLTILSIIIPLLLLLIIVIVLIIKFRKKIIYFIRKRREWHKGETCEATVAYSKERSHMYEQVKDRNIDRSMNTSLLKKQEEENDNLHHDDDVIYTAPDQDVSHVGYVEVTVDAEKSSPNYAEPDAKPDSNTIELNPIYEGTRIYEDPYQTVTGSSLYANPNMDKDKLSAVEIKKFPREKLRFIEKIGEGQFGEVHICEVNALGSLLDTEPNCSWLLNNTVMVAVKLLKSGVDKAVESEFIKEVKVMARLKHAHVVQLLGMCDEEPKCMVVEYMENGDLNQFLKNFTLSSSSSSNTNLTSSNELNKETLLYVCTQISSGMKYLSSQGFIHRDLATRNCLVGHSFTVKISDFGMSRYLYSKQYYRIEGKAVLPIRWMAPESLFYGTFTSQTDVWAFGVTVWEIFTLAKETPFAHLTDQQVIDNACSVVARKQRAFTCLPQPIGCSNELQCKMSRRPPSPSNIPVLKHGLRQQLNDQSSKPRTPRKLPQRNEDKHPSKKTVCNKSLGLEDGRIHDNQMHATVSAAGTKAPDARYNSSSSWCVNREENLSGFEDGVYLEIDFLKVTKITGIILAGPHNFPTHSYGSKIKLAQKLTQNGPLNSTILTTSNLVFPKSEYLKIEPPIYARFLRYLPLLNSNAKCVNMELLGCNAAFQDCNSPILNHQLSYLESSYYTTVNGQSKFLGKYIAEPISTFPWGPDVKAEFNSPYQEYVEVNLKEAYFLTAVKTFIPMYASRSLDMPAHFIFQFKSTNNMQWTNLTQLNNKLLVFNTSASLDNILEIQSKFKAMQIRIHPKIRAGKQIFLKLQLYGCLFKDAFQPKATVIVPTTPIKRTKMQTMFPTDTGRSTATNSVKAIILYYEIRQGNRYKDVPYVGKTNKDVLYDGKVGNIVDDTNSTLTILSIIIPLLLLLIIVIVLIIKFRKKIIYFIRKRREWHKGETCEATVAYSKERSHMYEQVKDRNIDRSMNTSLLKKQEEENDNLHHDDDVIYTAPDQDVSHVGYVEVTVDAEKSSPNYAEPDAKPDSNTIELNPIYEGTRIYEDPYQTVTGSSLYANPNMDKDKLSAVEIKKFPREKLRFIEKIGEGQFGEVHICEVNALGSLLDTEPNCSWLLNNTVMVAVKLLKSGVDKAVESEFIKEVKVMARLKHAHVVQLLGMCDEEPKCMVVEYMENGDLNQFLKNFTLSSSSSSNTNLTSSNELNKETLLYVCTQISSGMKYLSSQGFIHRDLATRNCLVGHSFTVKISDFGMSRYLYSKQYYRIEGKAVLPIRWMAPESLFYGTFTSQTDVWAFGVTVWEIFTLAKETPFAHLTDQQVIDNACSVVARKQRAFTCLPQPIGCSNELQCKMSRRPPSPSNIPVLKHGLRQQLNDQSSKPRTPRKLPQRNEDKHPSKKTDDFRETEGVIYITDNLIKKISKEEVFYKIFKLDLTASRDAKKKIKFIENLEQLTNLQILSISHNSIVKIERLGKLTNLEILDLSNNRIERIDGIETLQQLSVLNLENNKINAIPRFVGKKLKCLKTFKIARNNINSLHEMYKLRPLCNLVELSIEENPMCSLSHHKQMVCFLLRSIERLDGEIVTAEQRKDSDERFQQEEISYLEKELEQLEKRFHALESEKETSDEALQKARDNEMNIAKNFDSLREKMKNVEKDVQIKEDLLESKTRELSKACEKQFKLEQELAFYKLDAKFDELWKFPGYEREDDEDEYIDEDQSAYIGKARFKANSLAKERIIPSKAQIINLIKLTKQENEESKQVNEQIINDLEEALNIDIQGKQSEIQQATAELEQLRAEIENKKNKIKDLSENYVLPTDQTDAAMPLSKIADRENARANLTSLVEQAKEIQEAIEKLQNKLSDSEETLNQKESQLNQLRDEKNYIDENTPEYEVLMNEIAAKEEQCYQMNEFVDEIAKLLQESQAELEEKTEMIRAIELQLKLEEPDAQSERKNNLQDLVQSLTNHLEELKKQMKEQKSTINDLQNENRFLVRNVEQLESDLQQNSEVEGRLIELNNQLQGKEKELQDEIENNEEISTAYENLMKKMNKKKRHVGIGSHDVWRDPHVESLENRIRNSEGENERLHEAIERMNEQREAERALFEKEIEQGQAELEEAVKAARDAGDIEKEAYELNEQVNRFKAERDTLKGRINELEDDLNKEKSDSVPWKYMMLQLQSISDELDHGNVGRQSPSLGPRIKDKKLQRVFEDLRDKINENLGRNDNERNAITRKLEKMQAEIDEMERQLAEAKNELSKMKKSCRNAEQEADDSKQLLNETEQRLTRALQDKSNNAALIKDELAALHNQSEDLRKQTARLRKENNALQVDLEEAKERQTASEEHSKEVEDQLKTTEEQLEIARQSLQSCKSQLTSQKQSNNEEIQRLSDALKNTKGLLNNANNELNSLRTRLSAAEARMRQAESKAKELEYQLDALKAAEKSLKNKFEKEKSKHDNLIKAEREKAATLEQEFLDELHILQQQSKEDRKLIEALKNQLKQEREENESNQKNKREIMQLQLQNAEENNNRLLQTISRLEDENNALNDYIHELKTEAMDMNEKSKHEQELKDLYDRLKDLQRKYERKIQHDGTAMFNNLSRDIDELRTKIEATNKDNQLNLEKSLGAQNDLRYENQLLRHRLENYIKNCHDQVTQLRQSVKENELKLLGSNKSMIDPLINEYKAQIARFLMQLQIKDDELNGLMQILEDRRKISGYDKNDIQNLIAQVKNIEDTLAQLNSNLPAISIEHPSTVATKRTLNTSSEVHHYYYDDKWNLDPIIAPTNQNDSPTVHVHHHNNVASLKKKRKDKKAYKFCNISEHEDMDSLKLELRHLESRVEDAVLARTRRRQSERTMNDFPSYH
eukprot:gene15979-17589_t